MTGFIVEVSSFLTSVDTSYSFGFPNKRIFLTGMVSLQVLV